MPDNDGLLGGLDSGTFLSLWMQYRGMTVKQLAEESGVPEAQIQRLLDNRASLIPNSTFQLFRALNITITGELEPDEQDDAGPWGEPGTS